MHNRNARGSSNIGALSAPTKRGRRPKPVLEFPEPLTADWVEPSSFAAALALHAKRHDDSYQHLHRAIVRDGETFNRKTLQDWAAGLKIPHTAISFAMLARIEHRYRLPKGYFRAKLPESGKAAINQGLVDVPRAERRRIAWHLPDDFDSRPAAVIGPHRVVRFDC